LAYRDVEHELSPPACPEVVRRERPSFDSLVCGVHVGGEVEQVVERVRELLV
jgi:hypothetical protein